MRLFGRKGEATKKWRLRALLVDPHETKITLIYFKAEASAVLGIPEMAKFAEK